MAYFGGNVVSFIAFGLALSQRGGVLEIDSARVSQGLLLVVGGGSLLVFVPARVHVFSHSHLIIESYRFISEPIRLNHLALRGESALLGSLLGPLGVLLI